MSDLYTRLWKLPSGSIVKVTRELRERLDSGEFAAVPLIGAVYVASKDPSLKRLEVRRDWFDAHARAA